MRVKVIFRHEAVAQNLRPDIRVHVLPLLADGHFGEHRLRADGVAHAHTGGDDLRERTGVEDDAVRIKRLDARQRLAFMVKVAVGVVFQNHYVVRFGKLIQAVTLFKAHRDAGGVLEVWNRIDELHVLFGLKRLFQRFHVHTVRVHRDADELCFVGTEVV